MNLLLSTAALASAASRLAVAAAATASCSAKELRSAAAALVAAVASALSLSNALFLWPGAGLFPPPFFGRNVRHTKLIAATAAPVRATTCVHRRGGCFSVSVVRVFCVLLFPVSPLSFVVASSTSPTACGTLANASAISPLVRPFFSRKPRFDCADELTTCGCRKNATAF